MVSNGEHLWSPSPEEVIEAKYGPEVLHECASLARGVHEYLKRQIAEIDAGEGSIAEKRSGIQKDIQLWKNFLLALYSPNAADRSNMRLAIAGATALLAAERTHQNLDDARALQEALERRYNS